MKFVFVSFLFSLSFLAHSQTVTIGKQVWMSMNLDLSVFRNGDSIPQAKTDVEWEKSFENKQPAWCYYGGDAANGTKYGKLYNWYAVSDPRGLAPVGYHVPTDAEWTVLTDYLGDGAGKKMKSASGWKDNENGTNESGFSALPGGLRKSTGTFQGIRNFGYWWSSTEHDKDFASIHYVYSVDGVYSNIEMKTRGISVRCIKD